MLNYYFLQRFLLKNTIHILIKYIFSNWLRWTLVHETSQKFNLPYIFEHD